MGIKKDVKTNSKTIVINNSSSNVNKVTSKLTKGKTIVINTEDYDISANSSSETSGNMQTVDLGTYLKYHLSKGSSGVEKNTNGKKIYDKSKVVIKSNNTTANPTTLKCLSTVDIPSNIKQTGYTVTCYGKEGWWLSGKNLAKIASGTLQESVHNLWVQNGARYKKGIAVMNVNGEERYLIATTSTLGKVGDILDVKLRDGSTLKCVVADQKSSNDSNYTKYGHASGSGINVLEFEVDKDKYLSSGGPTTATWGLDWDSSSPVTTVQNFGSLVSNPSLVTKKTSASVNDSVDTSKTSTQTLDTSQKKSTTVTHSADTSRTYGIATDAGSYNSNNSYVNSKNGITYKLYDQGMGDWAGYVYSDGATMKNNGCMLTSASVLSSAVDSSITPGNFFNSSYRHEFVSNSVPAQSNGNFQAISVSDPQTIISNLQQGNPAIVMVKGYKKGGSSSFTTSQHYMALLDISDDGSQVFVGNSHSTDGGARSGNGWYPTSEVLTSVNEATVFKPSDSLVQKFQT